MDEDEDNFEVIRFDDKESQDYLSTIFNHEVTKPHVFVQFQGTDLCGDFWCKCGASGHIDVIEFIV